MQMPFAAMIFGLLLCALGGTAYAATDLLGGGKPYQISALSPAFVGTPLAILGVLSIALPNLRKHFMHVAAMIGLFGIIGGLAPCILRGFDFNETAVKVGLGMTVLSAVFLVLCIKSFRDARKARTAAAVG